uniref:Isoform b of Receptor-type guanylate cyclase gcy-27 n=2 Tax=Caenorhabditis elegans TaxID=6239 RepID=Q9XU42-2
MIDGEAYFEKNSTGKLGSWGWRDVNLQFIICTLPVPIYFVVVAIWTINGASNSYRFPFLQTYMILTDRFWLFFRCFTIVAWCGWCSNYIFFPCLMNAILYIISLSLSRDTTFILFIFYQMNKLITVIRDFSYSVYNWCYETVIGENTRKYKMTWKVPKESLKIIVNKNADARMQRELENRTAKDEANALTSRRRFRQIKHIDITNASLDFLYNLKQLKHDNLANFYGIQLNDDLNTMTILHALVERGTLEEFCLDRDFGMDETFKSAFMRDILKGLQYLHLSPVAYHGHLHAATCLIDINWVLKIALYGVTNFVCDNFDAENITMPDRSDYTISYAQYVCFPPEHIREYDATGKLPTRFVRGSKQGDIYCVGMIFYMMIEREDPYRLIHSVERPGSGLMMEILDHNLMPFISNNETQEDTLLDKCKECWNRDPEKRPTIENLRNAIAICYADSKGNLIDQMIRMNEKYADELETLVAARSADLALAQMQTMRLLNEMLPASIAKDLKNGVIAPARSYASATVMFVQICDFIVILKRRPPKEVIGFLNDIFDQFDTVIKRHDAYKVETTGETYMVASGVPNENEGRHVFEVAEMSLEIRAISLSYTLENDKNYKLRVRIGFHAGPIAAGVIGIKNPRYCLFGDTVNFASRMQSNCPPLQIQTSEITARMLLATHEYKLVKRGIVHVKGKGEVNCYWLNEHIHKDEEIEESGTISHPLES